MTSMNNWLGFSLSPQVIPSSQVPQDHHHSAHTISESDCFDLTSADSTMLPCLNLPAGPLGILEAFNRSNQSSQDWNLKEVSTNYKNSMIMGRSSCNINPSLENQEAPKLENFLGVHSFSSTDQNHKPDGENYIYPNNPSQTNSTNGGGGGGGMANNSTTAAASSTIGLSMIKNWLRKNPTTQASSSISQHEKNRNDGQELHDAAAVLGATNATVNCANTSTASARPHHQNLSLSMSTGSKSASALPLPAGGGSSDGDNGGEMSSSSDNKQPNSSSRGMAVGGGCLDAQSGAIEAVPGKSLDTFGQRTSIYRGVTRHRWTGRYEAHLWDNSCRREGQTRKGRQVYLGGYDKEEKAARAYDLAALKYWGTNTTSNFPISNYEKEIEEMKHMTRQEYVASLRRKSSGFSRGASIYRGVTRHHQHGRWQARIGRVAGNKDLYLGTFSTQEEAAEAYDIAAIKFRGLNAVTNFEISRYDVKSILESNTLPIGGAAKRLKDAEQAEIMALNAQRACDEHMSSHLTDGMSGFGAHHAWPTIAFQQSQPLSMHYPYGQQQRLWCKQENDSEGTHSYQDFHQLQLGNAHNFLQPPLHNLMSLDSSSMEHSSGSNSVMYSQGGGQSGENAAYQGVGYGSSSNNGYLLPMSTVITDQEGNNQGNGFGGNMYGSSDPYQTRNFYYHPHHQLSSSNGTLKAGLYDQGSSCNTRVPTAVPTLAARTNNMAVCHGSSTFTVWNDT